MSLKPLSHVRHQELLLGSCVTRHTELIQEAMQSEYSTDSMSNFIGELHMILKMPTCLAVSEDGVRCGKKAGHVEDPMQVMHSGRKSWIDG